MTSRRPLKPIGYLFVPLAFLLTRARPVFDYFWPEKTKYKYRVDGKTDAETPPQKNQGGYDEVDPQR